MLFCSNRGKENKKGKFDNHERVSRLNEELNKLGMRTWFDEDGLEGHVVDDVVDEREIDGMRREMDSSEAVIICITKGYLEKVAQTENVNDKCKLEFTHASTRTSTSTTHSKAGLMYPVVMAADCLDVGKWKGAVGLVVGGRVFEDLSDDKDVEEVALNLVAYLKARREER